MAWFVWHIKYAVTVARSAFGPANVKLFRAEQAPSVGVWEKFHRLQVAMTGSGTMTPSSHKRYIEVDVAVPRGTFVPATMQAPRQ